MKNFYANLLSQAQRLYRHTCVAEWYSKFIVEGKTEHEAKLMVSKLLGHEREDVTRIYLASIKGSDADG